MDYSSDHIDFSPKMKKTRKRSSDHIDSSPKMKKTRKRSSQPSLSKKKGSLKPAGLPTSLRTLPTVTNHCHKDRIDLKAYTQSLEEMIDKVKAKYSRQKSKYTHLKAAFQKLEKDGMAIESKENGLERKLDKARQANSSLKDQNIILEN